MSGETGLAAALFKALSSDQVVRRRSRVCMIDNQNPGFKGSRG